MYSEGESVALVIQHAKHMWHIMSFVACLALPYLNDTIFGIRLLKTKYVFLFSLHLLSETFLIHIFCLKHFSFKEEFSEILL